MTEKLAEFGDVSQGRGVRSNELDHLASARFAHGVMKQHNRLRAYQARGIDQQIMLWFQLAVASG